MSEQADDATAVLLAMADGTRHEVRARLRAGDPAAAARHLLDEVATRAGLAPGPPTEVTVQFFLGLAGERIEFRALAGAGRFTIDPGTWDTPWVTVRQDLDELLLALYGPPGGRHDATLSIHVNDEPGPATWVDDPWLAAREAATAAAHHVLRGLTPTRPDLTDLAVRFGSDKWGGHWYTRHYERHFAPLREERVRVLEIGIGGYQAPDLGGGSLRMWKHYFRRGLVVGLDVFDKSGIREPRITTVQGRQEDAVFMAEVARRQGPFDIVIDDGSHLSSDVIASFRTLFPLLNPGGLYVVEDLSTSYWPGWGGDSEDRDNTRTSMGYFKSLADGLNHQELYPPANGAVSDVERAVVGMHIYHNIVFLEKGDNAEQPAPSWISRTDNPADFMASVFAADDRTREG
ncbi:class I SAM-dependent methyltransferase [Dactylosporangium fulvum]|uniref:Class I SAM-dependent methyltransferase n=1 Tax=Dactylosporangium fulvum TaxID=53359 RepID=A0ABY5WA76_9ACTN|nr:class I SAM-dependent methyltransferase [Dactylosporangium fulvum]UWP86119.1 class I SAM-dependent methyltransferase [Dactylosporangium fulvum]